MKKLFSQFFIFLPLFVSLFFFISQVKADTINIEITDDMFSKLSNINSYINTANETCLQNSSFCNYFIRYHNDQTYSDMYFLLLKSNSYPKAYLESGKLRANNAPQKYVFDSSTSLNTTSSFYNSSDWQMFQYDVGSIRLFLYASFDIPFKTIDNNTYVFTNGTNSYSVVNDGTNYCPTLYDLYNEWYSTPPTPPDNTPLLTSFVDIVIEKLTLVCNFFTSSYIYLSIFVIFILYFVIYLLRRFK